MIREIIDGILKTGLFEVSLIYALKGKLQDLEIARMLGVIKNCNYVVMRNEIKFNIKELEKRLDLLLGGNENDS